MPFMLLPTQTAIINLMGCMLSAASCNKWWMDEIIGTKDYSGEQAKIEKLGENNVFFCLISWENVLLTTILMQGEPLSV